MRHLLKSSLNRLTYKAGVAFVAFGLVFAATPVRAEIGQEPLAAHPEWGYKITGLGENGDEVALVFTNTTETTMSWTLPQSVGSIWYLVVGGGGGGGACGGNSYSAGGGGGAGGVLGDYVGSETGNTLDVNGGTSVLITIGAGGLGAKCTLWNQSSNKGGNGGNTSLTVGEVVITAYGGGGGGSANNTAGAAGGCGGGGAGSSGTGGTGGTGKVVEGIRQGYDGGSGGSPAAGSGGGGAGEVGAGSSSTAGAPAVMVSRH